MSAILGRPWIPLAVGLGLTVAGGAGAGVASAQPAQPPWIFAMHDPGAEGEMEAKGKRGWIVFTEAIGHDLQVLNGLGPGRIGGLAIHAYTHGGNGTDLRTTKDQLTPGPDFESAEGHHRLGRSRPRLAVKPSRSGIRACGHPFRCAIVADKPEGRSHAY